ncbi:GTP cyclohydrolase [Pectinatus frisingensis]|uniref:GTP cyclohydrolase n=1 Tax=Pectinatus frisingensis TaxID=865 RepID=UPI0018C8575D|nr:GTP cyclohydrolase [Pectinatus frisingensis]
MPKIQMAIVGPSDSVALLNEIAKEWADVLHVSPLIYEDASEISQIVAQYKESFDVWVFSGIVPYRRASALQIHAPLFYIPHNGASLYRTLLQINYTCHTPIRGISFDTFSEKEITETFTDANLPLPKMFIYHSENIVLADEITNYHYQLWEKGQTSIAVTCIFATYNHLKKMGVPVCRIWPTRSNIRTTLDIAIHAFEAERFKGGQLAVQQIVIEDFGSLVRSHSSYMAKKIELKLYEILVDYAEKLQGSIVSRGDGQYTIYSTRGIIEKLTDSLTVVPILDALARDVATDVSGGIGFGLTAYSAEENAFRALGLSKQRGQNIWMAVTDEKEVIGPLSSPVHLRYSFHSDEKHCQKIANLLNSSATTINKLLAALDKLDRDTIGAEDLAVYLSITKRSARRLLLNLERTGFASAAGEEMIGRGRPRKLYQIHLQSLLQSM